MATKLEDLCNGIVQKNIFKNSRILIISQVFERNEIYGSSGIWVPKRTFRNCNVESQI